MPSHAHAAKQSFVLLFPIRGCNRVLNVVLYHKSQALFLFKKKKHKTNKKVKVKMKMMCNFRIRWSALWGGLSGDCCQPAGPAGSAGP